MISKLSINYMKLLKTKDYEEHLVQLNSKLIFMMDEIFRESLSSYQVIAPVPSECFRSICNQINRVHAIVIDILAEPTLIRLFTDIHEKFKTRLKDRLKELNVVNDGGPKHAFVPLLYPIYTQSFIITFLPIFKPHLPGYDPLYKTVQESQWTSNHHY